MSGTLHSAIDLAEAQVALLGMVQAIEDMLHLALAVQSSRAVRTHLSGAAGGVRLDFPHGAAAIHITPDVAIISRERTVAGAGGILAYADVWPDPALLALVRDVDRKGTLRAEAAALMACVVTDDHALLGVIEFWLPLVEPALFRLAESMRAVLDGLRPGIIARCGGSPHGESGARTYCNLAAAMRRALMLATDSQAPWFAEVLAGFDWSARSPSLALVRERDMRSVLAGARIATRLGAQATARYHVRLETAGDAMARLDAIVALTAIGLAAPAERGAIADDLGGALDRLHRSDCPPTVLETARCAIEALRSGAVLVRPLRPGSEDAFTPAADRGMALFGLMQHAVHAPLGRLVPAWNGPLRMSEPAARRTFARAWGHDNAEPWPSSGPRDHAA